MKSINFKEGDQAVDKKSVATQKKKENVRSIKHQK
jgi:hypothetical protein